MLFALSLVVLLGSLAVILDGGRGYTERRVAQNAADAAAMAGTSKLDASDPRGSLSAVLPAACTPAEANGGFGTGAVDGRCGTRGWILSVHVLAGQRSTALGSVNPKLKPGYVQVEITSSFRSLMAGLIGLSDFAASSMGVPVNIPGNELATCCSFITRSTAGTNPQRHQHAQYQRQRRHRSTPARLRARIPTAQPSAAVESETGTGGLNKVGGDDNVVGSGDPEHRSGFDQGDYKPVRSRESRFRRSTTRCSRLRSRHMG